MNVDEIFGHEKKILVDNEGELDNQDFGEFCENLNITIKAAATESPYSNSLVERHNNIIGESVNKVRNAECSLEVALASASSAKKFDTEDSWL